VSQFGSGNWRNEGEISCTCQKFKGDVCLIALLQFYSTVCKMDMSVIMYCYCRLVASGTALLTWKFAVCLWTLLLTLDIEGEPTCPPISCCSALVYPDRSSTGTWSAVALNADSRLSSVINIYLLYKEIDTCTTDHYVYRISWRYICHCV
jgi:hypothetical protein